MLREATPPHFLFWTHQHPSLHGYSIFSTLNLLCQAPVNLCFVLFLYFIFFFFFFQGMRDDFFFLLLRVKKMNVVFSCWFIVLILYSDFFCNVCFLRKEIKCIMILKKNVDPIQSVLPDGCTNHPFLIYSCPNSFLSLVPPFSPSPISLMVPVGIHVHLFLRAFCCSHKYFTSWYIFKSRVKQYWCSEKIETMRWAAQYISGIHLSINALIFIELSLSSGSDIITGGLRM